MILLVRHGETEWNVERRFQGRGDSPLTERGRRQAVAVAALARDLVAREPSSDWRLVASPLGRAQATAAAIARATGLPVEDDERLAEVHCGAWEGLRVDEVAGRPTAPGASRAWIFDSPGGESFDDVQARIRAFLDDLPVEPRRRVIAVSHGAAGRILRGLYAGLPPEAILDLDVPQNAIHRLQNGQIDRFDCEPFD